MLAEKQKQVLQLLSDGATQKEIACSMGLSSRTIESILAKLRSKFECPNNEKLIKLCTKAEQIQ